MVRFYTRTRIFASLAKQNPQLATRKTQLQTVFEINRERVAPFNPVR